MSDRKNLKINEDTFELLKRNKPKGWTWDYYLRELLYPYDDGALDDRLERGAND